MSAPAADRRLAAISNHLTSPQLVVILPDGANLTSVKSKRPGGQVTLLLLDERPIAEFTVNDEKKLALDLSSVGTPFEGVTKHVPIYSLVTLQPPSNTSSPAQISLADLWAAAYGLFTLYHEQEYIPTAISAFENAQEVAEYLFATGLARPYPSKVSGKSPYSPHNVDEVYYLNHTAFWQGAGTTGYHHRHWLPNIRPIFPTVPAFTRKDNVVAKHPLRPSKPLQGEVLYRRWCSQVGQMLELVHFDLEGATDALYDYQSADGVSRHLAAFHKWHNDPRVNKAWQEQGTLETHRKYIESMYADPHAIPCMYSWDGELFGYIEINYTKEDHVATYMPADQAAGEWDRGIHILVGEDKFLGGGRSKIWIRSLVHYLFLNDPRTFRILGEPDGGNPNVLRVADVGGFYRPTLFDFPYKRSILVFQNREKFFRMTELR
ncbi:hypothetical protein H1R20_g11549, partial [Candolleomyces eurysporus]